MALATGEYLLRVTSDDGAYSLSVSQNPLDLAVVWDTEPNDDPLRATPVFEDAAEIAGTANVPDDEDWFRIHRRATGSMLWTVDLAQASGAGPSTAELYGEDYRVAPVLIARTLR